MGLLGAFGAAAVKWGLTKKRTTRNTRDTQVVRKSRSGNGLAEPETGQVGVGATRELTRAEIARLSPAYDPHPDGDPDPGEIIWTWVPYVENDGRGKDRPVLIIARLGAHAVAGCYLSTKQHDGFISVGRGAWDVQGRESFINPSRILFVSDRGMRREGHVVPPDRFDQAVRHIAELHGLTA